VRSDFPRFALLRLGARADNVGWIRDGKTIQHFREGELFRMKKVCIGDLPWQHWPDTITLVPPFEFATHKQGYSTPLWKATGSKTATMAAALVRAFDDKGRAERGCAW
jgi:hypothetical protein